MAQNQNITGFGVGRDFSANDISIVQNISNTIKPADPPPKNVRFKVKEPIQTFTGRESFLEELHKLVKEGQDGGEGGVKVLTQKPFTVVAATGGMGKTETVRVYLQLHAQEYDHIIWIDAEDNSSAKGQFLQLAMELKIFTDFDAKPKEFESILKEIFEKLLGTVLLVFDNAEGYEEDADLKLSGIRDLIPESLSPPCVKPTIIVTSRNQNWPLQKVIRLDLWTEAEVVSFVIRRLGLEKTPANETLALQLGNVFGRLPIALQSAVAVILQQIKRGKKYGIQSLIDEYEKGSRKVLAQKPSDANMRPTQTSITMLVLWNISLEKIVKFEDGELAIKILCFMAYMSPTRIPQDFLFGLFQNTSAEDSFENALEILEDYSLIGSSGSNHHLNNQTTQDANVKNVGVNRSNKSYSYDLVYPGVSLSPEELQTVRKLLDDIRERSRIEESPDSDPRSLSIHRMIQDATLENLRSKNNNEGPTPHSIFYESTFSNETQVLDNLSVESMKYIGALTEICCGSELVENLIQITNHVSTKLHVKQFKDLTKKVARILRLTKNFTKYAELLERVMGATPSSEILEKINLKWDLATAYEGGGQVQKSLDLYLEVLEVLTRVRGPQHADTLNIKFFVANALRLMGKYDEAAGKFKELLKDFESNGDTQSPLLLQTKSGYAVALLCQLQTKQSLEEAFETLREVLQEQEKDLDLNSEQILQTKFNIASVLEAQGKFQEAATIMFQNIRDAAKTHRPTSLFKSDCLRKYAKILIQQGKQDEAAPILLQLLEGEELHLGPEHPSTLHTRNELALLYVAAEEFEKAVALLDVDMFSRVFGPENPNTIAASSNLAFAMMKLEKFEEAVPLFLDIFKIRSEVLGPHHPDAVVVLEALEKCQKRLGERKELIKSFVELTWVSEEVGLSLLQASNWNMEVTIHTFFDSDPNECSVYSEGLDQTIIPSRAATPSVQNENGKSISLNTNETKLELEETQLGPRHPSTFKSNLSLARVYLATKELDKAEALLDVELMERIFGPENSLTLNAASVLSDVREQQGRFGDALALSHKVLRVRKKILVPNHEDILSSMHNISILHIIMDEYEKAAEVAQEVLEREQEVLGKDHPSAIKTFNLITSCMKLLVSRNNLIMTFMALTSVDAETGKFFLMAYEWNFEAALDSYRDSNPNPSTTLTAAQIKNNLIRVFMAMTKVDAETGKSFLNASNWDMKAALDTYRKSNSNVLIPDQENESTLSRTLTDAEIPNNSVRIFMTVTGVNAETGKSFLEASDWKLKVALEAFCDSILPNKDIADLNLQAHALIPSAAATDANNQYVATVSCNKTEVNQMQDLEVQVETVAKSNQPTKSILFCLAGGTRFPGQFGVSSTVKDLYKFVNEKRPELADSNYVLTLYPNIQLTKMEQTLKEAKIPKNVAVTLKRRKE